MAFRVWPRLLGTQRLIRLSSTLLALVAMACLAFALWCWRSNVSVELASVSERELAWQRSIQWIRLHEEALLSDGNSALWWMLHEAAQRHPDPYLSDLVRRFLERQFPDLGDGYSPWRRLVDGRSAIGSQAVPLDVILQMLPYQRDFLHAATCRPVVTPDQRVSGEFLTRNQCERWLPALVVKDKVCSTHQLLALQVYRRSGCPDALASPALRQELTQEVMHQMQWLPLFEDAYIQRVLVLHWQQGARAVRPVWVNRVLSAQGADGGWSGKRRVLSWPIWAQPAALFNLWANWRGQEPVDLGSDFHATAQAILLIALSLEQSPQGYWALSEQ